VAKTARITKYNQTPAWSCDGDIETSLVGEKTDFATII
jgi:hypothetical protein